jgi:hypothetical protein
VTRLIALLVTAASAVPAAGAATSTPPTHQGVVNATFGAAPSSSKGVDGRPYFTFDTTPGGQVTDHLALINYSHRSERLAVYTVDAVPATNGEISFPAQSAPRTAAGAWMAVGTPGHSGFVILKPRSTTIVPIRVAVPMNAPPGDHIGAVVASLAGLVKGRFGQGGTQRVKFDQRIAVKAAFRVTGPTHPLLTITNLTASYDGPIDPFASGDVTVRYTVHNGGNVVLGGPQTVSVHGLFGQTEFAQKVATVPPLLPGASYPVTVRVPDVYPELLMSASVTIGTRGLQGDVTPGLHPVTSSVHFLAIPWILLVVLLLLILGLARWYWRRRRRRHEPDGRPIAVPEPEVAA